MWILWTPRTKRIPKPSNTMSCHKQKMPMLTSQLSQLLMSKFKLLPTPFKLSKSKSEQLMSLPKLLKTQLLLLLLLLLPGDGAGMCPARYISMKKYPARYISMIKYPDRYLSKVKYSPHEYDNVPSQVPVYIEVLCQVHRYEQVPS